MTILDRHGNPIRSQQSNQGDQQQNQSRGNQQTRQSQSNQSNQNQNRQSQNQQQGRQNQQSQPQPQNQQQPIQNQNQQQGRQNQRPQQRGSQIGRYFIIGLAFLVFGFLVTTAIIHYYSSDEVAEEVVVVVSPIASSGNLATAFVSVPAGAGEFVFQWEDKSGTVMSDTDSGPTDGYSGDLEVFISPEATEIFPVVYFGGEKIIGDPLYVN